MSIYDTLGIKKYINAHDTYTIYGGSRMSAASFEAMADAAKWFVDIDQLQQVLGDKIAELTHNEGAFITNGASGGVLLATAACMTRGNMYRYMRLPDTKGIPHQVIVMRCQRNAYDKAIEAAGATIVEIGDADETLLYELEGAINEETAAIFYFPSSKYARASLSLEDTAKVAHKYNIPLVVDAAAQLPPVENLWRFCEAGADMAIFSGGKTLCGPQASGIIVGSRYWIDICRKIGAPAHGICRSSKTGREEMIALYIALKAYVEMDHEKNTAHLYRKADKIANALTNMGVFKVSIADKGPVGQSYPRVFGVVDAPFSAQAIARMMKEQDPGIYIGVEPVDNAIYISPLNLHDDEVDIVIKSLDSCIKKLLDTNS